MDLSLIIFFSVMTAFRIAPPLVISEDEIFTACRLLNELLDDAAT